MFGHDVFFAEHFADVIEHELSMADATPIALVSFCASSEATVFGVCPAIWASQPTDSQDAPKTSGTT
jgi:hypothetical protein